jgi:hypothetical protein
VRATDVFPNGDADESSRSSPGSTRGVYLTSNRFLSLPRWVSFLTSGITSLIVALKDTGQNGENNDIVYWTDAQIRSLRLLDRIGLDDGTRVSTHRNKTG